MVGVEEVAVTNDEVVHGIGIPVRLLRVAAKHIEHRSPVVVAGGDLAVRVVAHPAARICEPLDFVALGSRYDAIVGVAVPAATLERLAHRSEARADPVLEVELLVLAAFPPDQDTTLHGADADSE